MYAPRGEADAWIKATDFIAALFVDGNWRKAGSGGTFPVREPSSGKVLCDVAEAGEDDVQAAVAARVGLGQRGGLEHGVTHGAGPPRG